jgi:hypothetical protein
MTPEEERAAKLRRKRALSWAVYVVMPGLLVAIGVAAWMASNNRQPAAAAPAQGLCGKTQPSSEELEQLEQLKAERERQFKAEMQQLSERKLEERHDAERAYADIRNGVVRPNRPEISEEQRASIDREASIKVRELLEREERKRLEALKAYAQAEADAARKATDETPGKPVDTPQR